MEAVFLLSWGFLLLGGDSFLVTQQEKYPYGEHGVYRDGGFRKEFFDDLGKEIKPQCLPNTKRSCYSGSTSTKHVGICRSGWQICNGEGEWGGCQDEIIPGQEVCVDKLDNDCDGKVDEKECCRSCCSQWRRTVLKGHKREVNSLSWRKDDKFLASASRDKTLRIWDIQSRKTVNTFSHSSGVMSVSWNPLGIDMLAVSTWYPSELLLWRVSLQTSQKFANPNNHVRPIFHVTFSKDGHLVSSSLDGTIKLWNVEKRFLIRTLPGHKQGVFHTFFSLDGTKLLSSGFDGTVKIWDTATGSLTKTFSGHQSAVYGVQWIPGTGLIASSSTDHTVKIWEESSGKVIKTFSVDWVTDMFFSQKKSILVGGSHNGNIYLWNINNGWSLHHLSNYGVGVNSAVFSNNGKSLAVGSYDGTVVLFECLDPG